MQCLCVSFEYQTLFQNLSLKILWIWLFISKLLTTNTISWISTLSHFMCKIEYLFIFLKKITSFLEKHEPFALPFCYSAFWIFIPFGKVLRGKIDYVFLLRLFFSISLALHSHFCAVYLLFFLCTLFYFFALPFSVPISTRCPNSILQWFRLFSCFGLINSHFPIINYRVVLETQKNSAFSNFVSNFNSQPALTNSLLVFVASHSDWN